MEMTYDDWREKHPAKTRTPEDAFQRNAAIAVATKAETVVNHEGWQTFLDHLQSVKDVCATERARLERTIVDGDIFGDGLTAMKLKARELKGKIDGLDVAVNLIPSLIERGKAVQQDPAA